MFSGHLSSLIIDFIVSINGRVCQSVCGRGPCTQSNMSEAGNTEELNLGCSEAGEDCFGKVITYGGKSAIAGGCVKIAWCALFRCILWFVLYRWSGWICRGLFPEPSA